MLQITENAKKTAIHLMKEEGKSGFFIRVGVKQGGCSGLSYELSFDNQLGENDKVFEFEPIKIVCAKNSFLYLIGTVLDYEGGLKGKGFVFSNPNAQKTCGCGESFAV